MSGPIRIYGKPITRAFRVIWAAEELGLPYEIEHIDYTESARHQDLVALHPLGKLPVVEDGDLVLAESLAIVTYLFRKHGGPLLPTTLEEEARTLQWTIWGACELDEAMVDLLHHRATYAHEDRDPAAAQRAEGKLQRSLAYLNGKLSRSPYLLGNEFKLADLCVSCLIYSAWYNKVVDLSAWTHLTKWLQSCLGRPAALRARKLRE